MYGHPCAVPACCIPSSYRRPARPLRAQAAGYRVRRWLKGDIALEYLQEVVIYLDPEDTASQAALRFLIDHGVGCRVQDVRADPDLWRHLEFMGATRLPTIVVNGIAVEGFDDRTLRDVLGI